MLLSVGLLIGTTGVAAAELSYRTGHYDVDPCAITTNRTCSEDNNGTLRMIVREGKFIVKRISLTETCDNGVRSFDGPFTFRAGSNAKLNGKINDEGRFRGKYESDAGEVKVRGRVQRKRLHLFVTESGSFTQEGEPTFNCAGEIEFNARRS